MKRRIKKNKIIVKNILDWTKRFWKEVFDIEFLIPIIITLIIIILFNINNFLNFIVENLWKITAPILFFIVYYVFEKIKNWNKYRKINEKKNNNLDNPIESIKNDLLNRKPLIDKIKKNILGKNKLDHFVLNINADWGFGKTSVANFIKEAINNKKDNKNIIVEFNPWKYSKDKRLIEPFLYELGVKSNVDTRAIISTLGTTHWTFSLLNFLFKKSLNDFKKDFIKKIQKDNKNIYIFIDDIDRLTTKEDIYEIFKIIAQFKNEKNFYYILSFSEDEVLKIINEKNELNRGKYFEKIIDKSFILQNREEDLDNYMIEQIKLIIEDEPDFFQPYSLRRAYKIKKWDIFEIKNLRMLKKLLKTFKTNYSTFKDDFEVSDIYKMSILEEFYQKVYERLIDFKLDLGERDDFGWLTGNEEFAPKRIKDVYNINLSEAKIVSNLLKDIFDKNKDGLKSLYEYENIKKWFAGEELSGWDSNSFIESRFNNFDNLKKNSQKEALEKWKFIEFATRKIWDILDKKETVNNNFNKNIEAIFDRLIDISPDLNKDDLKINYYGLFRAIYIYFRKNNIKYDLMKKVNNINNIILLKDIIILISHDNGEYNDNNDIVSQYNKNIDIDKEKEKFKEFWKKVNSRFFKLSNDKKEFDKISVNDYYLLSVWNSYPLGSCKYKEEIIKYIDSNIKIEKENLSPGWKKNNDDWRKEKEKILKKCLNNKDNS